MSLWKKLFGTPAPPEDRDLDAYAAVSTSAETRRVEALVAKGVRVPAAAVAEGLSGVRWPGRLQVVGEAPRFIVDGAHNADSARRLVAAIRDYFGYERLFWIVGASADKDIAGICRELAALPSVVIVTRSRHPRATDPAVLEAEFSKWGLRAQVAPDVPAAMARALSQAGPGDLICAAGSLFVVAEVLEDRGRSVF